MTLEDMEALGTDDVPAETLAQYVGMLVGENENIKHQMTQLLDRQDRVAAVWGRFILAINSRVENEAKSI